MSLDYTKVSHEGLLEDWENRLLADDRFKNLNKASIYQMLVETIAGISDIPCAFNTKANTQAKNKL